MNSFRFSTSDLPVSERMNAVRALHERGILPLEPLADRPVTVQISKRFLPGAGILSGRHCRDCAKEAARKAQT